MRTSRLVASFLALGIACLLADPAAASRHGIGMLEASTSDPVRANDFVKTLSAENESITQQSHRINSKKNPARSIMCFDGYE